uniref:vitronectin-like n=1 Tax=Myxine glutinosa TaxID=7769 RepID=UPI00358F3CDC
MASRCSASSASVLLLLFLANSAGQLGGSPRQSTSGLHSFHSEPVGSGASGDDGEEMWDDGETEGDVESRTLPSRKTPPWNPTNSLLTPSSSGALSTRPAQRPTEPLAPLPHRPVHYTPEHYTPVRTPVTSPMETNSKRPGLPHLRSTSAPGSPKADFPPQRPLGPPQHPGLAPTPSHQPTSPNFSSCRNRTEYQQPPTLPHRYPTRHPRVPLASPSPSRHPVEFQPGRDGRDVCASGIFDAFANSHRNTIFAFRGEWYWEAVPGRGVLPGFPRRISHVWGIHPPISAAFTRLGCFPKTYIFKNGWYWRFTNGVRDPGHPRRTETGFPRTPADTSAALTISEGSRGQREHAIFFSGSDLWRYLYRRPQETRSCRANIRHRHPHLPAGPHRSPRPYFVARLHGRQRRPRSVPLPFGFPTEMTAAIVWPPQQLNHAFIFSRDVYYKVDLQTWRLVTADPPYPRPITKYWFNCRD